MATITRVIRKSDKQQRPTSNPREILLQMSDEDLMTQFQAGVVEAFNILIDRNRDDEEYEFSLPDESYLPDRHAERTLQGKYIQEAEIR